MEVNSFFLSLLSCKELISPLEEDDYGGGGNDIQDDSAECVSSYAELNSALFPHT